MPGIGPYTAGAIASLAFDRPAPLLDGNVARVLSRLFAIEGDVRAPRTRRRLWRLAGELLPRAKPRAFNEGLMELGALICRPATPLCPRCPLRKSCRAFAEDRVGDFPRRGKAAASKTVALLAAVVRDARGRLLVVQNPREGLFGGMWTAPEFAAPRRLTAAQKKEWLAEQLRAQFGADFLVGRRRTVRHDLSHRRLVVEAYDCSPAAKLRGRRRRWLDPNADLSDVALPAYARKILGLPRHRAFRSAVVDKKATKCAKLDPAEEKSLAEESVEVETWPVY